VTALLVALEGIDGSGKGTQAARLRDSLEREGHSCTVLAFPRYEATAFGQAIARYLNGEFGDLHDIGPYFAALLYAGDRLESLPLIERELAACDVLVFDRYVASNLAHQAAKLPADQRAGFIAWLESIEYGVYRLPAPHLTLYLEMPVAIAQQLIAQKPSRRYTSKPADLHEADAAYLRETAAIYGQLARRNRHWRVIDCCLQGRLRSPESIHLEVLGQVQRSRAELRA
jgi:dTMP kinase